MSDDIGKLADEVIGRMKTTEELKHVPFEMYARVLDRAVKAEAERDALSEELERWELDKEDINNLYDVLGKAQTERDVMREALVAARAFINENAHWLNFAILLQIDAALNQSPAGREG